MWESRDPGPCQLCPASQGSSSPPQPVPAYLTNLCSRKLSLAFTERLKQQRPGNFAYLRRLAGEQGADGCLAFKAAVKETHHFRKSTQEPAAAEELSPSIPGERKPCVGGQMREKEH